MGHEADKGTTAEFPSPASLCFLHWNKIIGGKKGEGKEKVEKRKKIGGKKEKRKCFPSGESDANRCHFCEQFKGHNHIQKREMCVWFCLCLFCFWQWLEGLEVVCLIDFKSSIALPPSKSYHELHMNYTARQHRGQSCVCF